jgi:hypothetical protein
MNYPGQTGWVVVSERFYRVLLQLYPADYRREYGALMVQLFRDVAREKYRRQGLAGMALWWCVTLLDLTLTVIEQWRKVKFTMSKSSLIQLMIRLTGILLVTGGSCVTVAAFSQFQPGDHYTYYGLYQMAMLLLAPGYFFIGLGCIGLGLRPEQPGGRAGQWSLYVSGIGALVMAVGLSLTLVVDSLGTVWMVGIALHTAALTVFGLLYLWKPSLPIFRALPLQLALGMAVMFSGVLRTDSDTTNNTLSFLFALGIGLVWLAIGQTVNRQQMQTIKTQMEPVPGA